MAHAVSHYICSLKIFLRSCFNSHPNFSSRPISLLLPSIIFNTAFASFSLLPISLLSTVYRLHYHPFSFSSSLLPISLLSTVYRLHYHPFSFSSSLLPISLLSTVYRLHYHPFSSSSSLLPISLLSTVYHLHYHPFSFSSSFVSTSQRFNSSIPFSLQFMFFIHRVDSLS